MIRYFNGKDFKWENTNCQRHVNWGEQCHSFRSWNPTISPSLLAKLALKIDSEKDNTVSTDVINKHCKIQIHSFYIWSLCLIVRVLN